MATRSKRTVSRRIKSKPEELYQISAALQPSPLITQRDPGLYRNSWKVTDAIEQFKRCRLLAADTNDFVGNVVYLKQTYFGQGFRVMGQDDPKISKWLDKLALLGISLRKLSDDIWQEFLIQDNVVVFWRKNGAGISVPVVLDCEICNYTEIFGIKSLTVKMVPSGVVPTKDQVAALGPIWADAYTKGTAVTLDEAKGDFFKVLTRAKLGKGFCKPRLAQIFEALGIRELLGIADFGGAWEIKDLVQHVTKGHEIKQGARAGEATHFLTPRQRKIISDSLSFKLGPKRIISNFDVDIKWKYLAADYFDPKRYATTMSKLENWAGAPSIMFKEQQITDVAMDAFRTEVMANRELVSGLIEEILNDQNFLPVGGKVKVRVGYNPGAFLSTKMLLQWVTSAQNQGLMSPQTARGYLGLDNDTESELMNEAHADAASFTPVFEAKQGMVGENTGGRPSAKAGTETPPPDPTKNAPPPTPAA